MSCMDVSIVLRNVMHGCEHCTSECPEWMWALYFWKCLSGGEHCSSESVRSVMHMSLVTEYMILCLWKAIVVIVCVRIYAGSESTARPCSWSPQAWFIALHPPRSIWSSNLNLWWQGYWITMWVAEESSVMEYLSSNQNVMNVIWHPSESIVHWLTGKETELMLATEEAELLLTSKELATQEEELLLMSE